MSVGKVERLSDSESDADQLTLASGHESSALSDSNDEYKPEPYSGYFSKQRSEDSSEELPTKKAKIDMSPAATISPMPTASSGPYAKNVFKMMAKMGYQEGKGLGKNEQGRVEIVEASKQRGRRGLGLHIKGLEMQNIEWNPDEEMVSAEETIEWLPSYSGSVPVIDELRAWKRLGTKKLVIDDETNFVSKDTLNKILSSKNIFDELDGEELRKARARSNPFETIRGVIFQNRAAMKMANIDALTDFMFTKPTDKNTKSILSSHSLLYFADMCAGPGGFSEYVLWRKKGDAKGFGLTLRDSNDFKLEEFFAGPSQMFEPHYGVGGLQGDGDIFKPENQECFIDFVKQNTENKGVHFVMADGGFSVEGQENLQEILSKQLYLCQFLVALKILRNDGHFVCKLFDLFTSFSVGLIYLMHLAFNKICICKPVTSRPANSERYIICKWLREDAGSIGDYLHEINLDLCDFTRKDPKRDVVEVVPLNVLTDDTAFYEYVRKSNELLGKKQIQGLRKIQTFVQDPNLHEDRQTKIRKQCLHNWQIPDKARTEPPKPDPKRVFQELMKEDNNMFDVQHEVLSHQKLRSIQSLYDYRCFVTGSNKRHFIMGLERGHVYIWNVDSRNQWRKLDEQQIHIELPSETLIEAEIVQEFQGEGKGQRKQNTIHAVDAYYLCGTDVRNYHFNERIDRLRKFVKAITKTTRSDLAPVSVPDIYRLEEIHKVFEKLDMKLVKGHSRQSRLCYCREKNRYFLPTGVHFIKTVKDPWMMCRSKSSNWKYWFNKTTKKSTYHYPPESSAMTRDCRLNSLHWTWEEGIKVHDLQDITQDKNKVSKEDILNFIENKLAQ